MKNTSSNQNRTLANCLRFLSIDAIEKANSGHPGMPMGMADTATILFTEFLKFDVDNPHWLDRDRFVLSAGHGSMLLYSILYLTGYKDISIDDIKTFRQLGSKCAGHPEYGHIDAIETTTGPLGQGLANSVGMAISEKILAQKLGKNLINHKVYCLVGDGCLMEGIAQESISLAGHLGLNNLIVLWDDNSISIDGKTSITTSENTKLRFEACGWDVIQIDGHNFDEIRNALLISQNSAKPVMIACKTIIGFGSPNKSDSEKVHGSPLGAEEAEKTRKNLCWEHAPFMIPQDLLAEWRSAGKRSRHVFSEWEEKFLKLDPVEKSELKRIQDKNLPENFLTKLEDFRKEILQTKPKQATRKSSQIVLEFLSKNLPELLGGSADLTESVLTKTSNSKSISRDDFSGSYIHYGIREHAMGAIMNGIALHSGMIPYGGTFLVFSDYMKPAIRLAALMKQRVIYIFTHDSIGLGEDGPTHQPIEHLAALRAIPNLNVFRPADALEVLDSFELALQSKNTPSAIVLTRQNLTFVEREKDVSEISRKSGGYVVIEAADNNPDVIIISNGSELSLALEARTRLESSGIRVRVVSMPCFEIFDLQSKEYQNSVLGDNSILKVGVEAAISQGWHRYLGRDGIFIGMSNFGASGKAEDLYKHFGITAEAVCELILNSASSGGIGIYRI